MDNKENNISNSIYRGILETISLGKETALHSVKLSQISKKIIPFPTQNQPNPNRDPIIEDRSQEKTDPHLLEVLKELIQLKFQDNDEFQNQLLLCYFQAHEKGQINPTRIAKLLYLIDHHPKSIASFFKKNKNTFFNNLEELFSKKMSKLKSEVIKNDNPYIATQIPATLIDIIWTSTGYLNIHIIEKLKSHFFPIEKISLQHEQKILFLLDQLAENQNFIAELFSIKRDSDENLEIDHAVRAQLSLPPQTAITSLHLQKTALMALFSHPRQNLANSCFASFLPISLMTADPIHVLKNLKSLLIYDCLEFKSDKNVITQIPYNLVIASEDMESFLRIDCQGELFDQNISKGSLAQLPEWQAVCRGLDINDPKAALENTLRGLGSLETGKIYKIQKKDLLKALCRTLKSSYGIPYLLSLAKFYYKSVSYPPLLACWENAIATLAETQANSYLKTVLINSILSQILVNFENLLPESVLKNQQIASFIINTLSSRLKKTIRLAYDPDLRGIEGIEGGFALEVRLKKKWQQIHNSNDFLNICDGLLSNLHKQIMLSDFQEEKNELEKALKLIHENLNEEWVTNITNHLKNNLVKNLEEDSSVSESSPWSILTGHDADDLLKLYFGFIPPKIEFTPIATKDALDKLLSINYENKGKSQITQLPFRIKGFHACTLLVGTLQEKQTKIEQIKNSFKNAKEKISCSQITDTMHEELSKICDEWSKKTKKKFQFNKKELPKNISIHEFRNMIISLFSSKLKKQMLSEFEHEIDKNIVRLLPEELKQIWLTTIIPFADTNWHEGTQDLFFCFVYNPGAKKLDLWEMTEDKKIIRKRNTDMMFNKSWNIYFPFDP